MSWYEENVEEGVREAVRLLRDNGFNTTCSCHHDLQVTLDICLGGELRRLHDLLYNSGLRNYSIGYCMNVRDGYIVDQWVMLTLTNGDRAMQGQEVKPLKEIS